MNALEELQKPTRFGPIIAECLAMSERAFVMPSVGLTLDLFGTYDCFPAPVIKYTSVSEALDSDMEAIGSDFRKVVQSFDCLLPIQQA